MSDRGVQLRRLLVLGRALATTRRGLTVEAAAKAIGTGKATAARYLAIFEEQHLAVVERDPDHKQRQRWRAA